MSRKLILVVIDGLTPEVFEQAVERRTAPTLAELHAAGSYARAVSTFPSLTPVCMATLATGAHPDVHEIPHLVWYHRGEGRLVEYGSSFGAMRAAGTRRAIRDAIVEMNAHHLSRNATTVFESLEDAGLTAAAVNTPCYRGRTRHVPTVPGLVRPVDGPRRFFYFSLFESDVTGAPLAIRTRTGRCGPDAYAAAVGRWLVTRDRFDFLFYYLPDYDYASHALGPGGAEEALRRSDQAVGALVEAGGRPGRVPAALRRRRLLGSRPDPRRSGGATPGLGRRRGPCHRVKPGRAWSTPRSRAGSPSALRGRTPSTSRCSWRMARPSRCETAASSGSCRFRRLAGPRAPGAREPERRRRAPSLRPRESSSPISGAAIMRAAGSHGSLLEGDSLCLLCPFSDTRNRPGRSPASRRSSSGTSGSRLRRMPAQPESSFQDVARCQGALGGCQARTQAAFIFVNMGAAEDDDWRRPARPGGTARILESAL